MADDNFSGIYFRLDESFFKTYFKFNLSSSKNLDFGTIFFNLKLSFSLAFRSYFSGVEISEIFFTPFNHSDNLDFRSFT